MCYLLSVRTLQIGTSQTRDICGSENWHPPTPTASSRHRARLGSGGTDGPARGLRLHDVRAVGNTRRACAPFVQLARLLTRRHATVRYASSEKNYLETRSAAR